jgi:TonB family protein
MRHHLIALFLFPAMTFAASPATLETRSQDHSLVVDVIPAGMDAEYSTRVIDLHTGELMASAKFTANDVSPESVSNFGDMQVRIRVRPTYNGLFASVEIAKGYVVLDSMDARWSLRPTGPGLHVGGPFANALRVGGDVKAPIVISKIEPMYSEEARRARISGIVILETLIDKTGTVREVNVLKPLPFGLDQAAVDAVKQWKFNPALKNGEPVDVVFNLTVNFKIDAPKPPAQ